MFVCNYIRENLVLSGRGIWFSLVKKKGLELCELEAFENGEENVLFSSLPLAFGRLTFYTLTSVCMFSILFSILSLKC